MPRKPPTGNAKSVEPSNPIATETPQQFGKRFHNAIRDKDADASDLNAFKLERILREFPGWPVAPSSQEAAELARELARVIVCELKDVEQHKAIAKSMGELSIPRPKPPEDDDFFKLNPPPKMPYLDSWSRTPQSVKKHNEEMADYNRLNDEWMQRRDRRDELRRPLFQAHEAAVEEWRKQVNAISRKWGELLRKEFADQACRIFRFEAEESWAREDDNETEDLVRGVLRPCQPMVVGGAEKSMKTSLSIELAAALTSGSAFLGLDVSAPVSVCAITLETRTSLWQQKFTKALEARGKDKAAIREARERLTLTADRSLLGKQKRAEFTQYLKLKRVGVVVVDPLYLGLPTRRTSDLAAMGRALRRLAAPIIEAGAAPVIVHHMTKAAGETPTFKDLSGAGIAAWMRSWLLVSRVSEYDGSGLHELNAICGSAGTHHQLNITIDEGTGHVTTRPASKSTTGGVAKRPVRTRKGDDKQPGAKALQFPSERGE